MNKFNTDGLLMTQDEGLELCIYHLRMAHVYFQVIPSGTREEEKALLKTELNRQLTDRGKVQKDFAYFAYISFINNIVDAYQDDKETSP